MRERVGHPEDDALGRGHRAVETAEAAGGVGAPGGIVVARVGGGRDFGEIAAERFQHAAGLIDGLQLAGRSRDEFRQFAYSADPNRAGRIDRERARRATVGQRNQPPRRAVVFEHAEVVRRVNVAGRRMLLDAPVDRRSPVILRAPDMQKRRAGRARAIGGGERDARAGRSQQREDERGKEETHPASKPEFGREHPFRFGVVTNARPGGVQRESFRYLMRCGWSASLPLRFLKSSR